MPGFFRVPEGVRVAPDGEWTVGGLPIRHPPSLRLLKARLHFSDEGAFLMDGPVRLPVRVDGPPFEVKDLRLDPATGQVRALLDDGSEERINELGMDETSGRFVCAVRGGRARAVLSRAAHQELLEHVEQKDGLFYLAVGDGRLPLRT
jgi:hypothetical protein